MAQFTKDPQQSDREFYLPILEFVVAARKHIIEVGSDFGLTSVQAVILLLLDEENPLPMKSFCELLCCDASNITGIVGGLEKKGLVVRENSPTDRRVKFILLSHQGNELQAELWKRLTEDNQHIAEAFTEDEMHGFRHFIYRLAEMRSIRTLAEESTKAKTRPKS